MTEASPTGSDPLDRLDTIEATARGDLDDKFEVRELTIKNCRRIIRHSANAIRALHRNDVEEADRRIADAEALIAEVTKPLESHGDVLYAGYFYDAVKEYAEAVLTRQLLIHGELPLPGEIGVATVPYLKGLGEAVGELRRRLLDQLRGDRMEDAERTFRSMEAIIDVLTSLDYPDGMTGGLRRTTDVARSLIERSRADLTSTVVQERLRKRLAED